MSAEVLEAEILEGEEDSGAIPIDVACAKADHFARRIAAQTGYRVVVVLSEPVDAGTSHVALGGMDENPARLMQILAEVIGDIAAVNARNLDKARRERDG